MSVDRAALHRGLEFLRRGDRRPPTAADVLAFAAGECPRRPAAAAHGHRRRWMARRPARRQCGPHAHPGRTTGGVHRATAAVPAARRRLAGVPLLARPRRVPRRRHGPGQDRPAPRPGAADREHGRAAARRCCVCPMSVVGNWRARGRRASRPACGCSSTTAATGCAATSCATRRSRRRPRRHHLRHRRPRRDDAGRRSTGAGWCSTRRRRSRTRGARQARAVRPLPAPAPRRADRHAGREPPRRAVVDHRLPQPGPARHRPSLPRALRHARSSAHGDAEAAGAAAPTDPARSCCAASRPTEHHRRPARQDRDEGRTATLTREQASLYQASSTTCWPTIESSDGHRAPRHRAGRADRSSSRSATTRPSSCRTARRSPAAPASSRGSTRCSRRSLAEGDRCSVFTQFARDRASCSSRTWRPVRPRRSPFLHGGVTEQRSATRWSSGSRTGDGPPLFLLSLKAGGTAST